MSGLVYKSKHSFRLLEYSVKLIMQPHDCIRMHRTRAERLISNVSGVDAIVVSNDTSPFLDSTFWYLTEQSSGTFEGSLAVVNCDGSLDVITSTLEEEVSHTGLGNIHIYHSLEERNSLLKEALSGCTKIGFNAHSSTYATMDSIKRTVGDVEFIDVGSAISYTKSIKDEIEIEYTKMACNISSKVAEEIPDMLSENISEKDVSMKIDDRMRKFGGVRNAFDTIVAFGVNSSQPHHTPCDYELKIGDVALFDFGTKYNMYCSDMTRTVFFGDPPNILKRAYEVVIEAQIAGIEEYYNGAPANCADLIARKIIDKSEFKGRFIHSFGHGIGMEVHQDISVS